MSLTINSKTVTADSIAQNAVGYVAPAHTLSWKDDFLIVRTLPKATSDFSGVARMQWKWSRDFTLTGALTPVHTGIINTYVTLPVGAASADIDSLINDYAAWFAHASAKVSAKLQTVNF